MERDVSINRLIGTNTSSRESIAGFSIVRRTLGACTLFEALLELPISTRWRVQPLEKSLEIGVARVFAPLDILLVSFSVHSFHSCPFISILYTRFILYTLASILYIHSLCTLHARFNKNTHSLSNLHFLVHVIKAMGSLLFCALRTFFRSRFAFQRNS